MPSCYQCYLLVSETGDGTYIGVTSDMRRRLRQHNGEIKGGAKATRRARPWRVVCTVQGFPDYRSVLQFEYGWKSTRGTAASSVVKRRLGGLSALLRRDRWSRNAPRADRLDYQLTLVLDHTETDQAIGATAATINARFAELARSAKIRRNEHASE